MVIAKLEGVAKSGEAIDIQKMFNCLTFDVIGEIALGEDFGTLSDPKVCIMGVE